MVDAAGRISKILQKVSMMAPLLLDMDVDVRIGCAESSIQGPNQRKPMKNALRPQQSLPSRPTVSHIREVLPRYMTWPEVISWSSLSRSTLRREIAASRFPAPETLSPGREAFRVDKLREWQEGRRDWADQASAASARAVSP